MLDKEWQGGRNKSFFEEQWEDGAKESEEVGMENGGGKEENGMAGGDEVRAEQRCSLDGNEGRYFWPRNIVDKFPLVADT